MWYKYSAIFICYKLLAIFVLIISIWYKNLAIFFPSNLRISGHFCPTVGVGNQPHCLCDVGARIGYIFFPNPPVFRIRKESLLLDFMDPSSFSALLSYQIDTVLPSIFYTYFHPLVISRLIIFF
jgi:hypothetical protein